jgi:hypothetical protein
MNRLTQESTWRGIIRVMTAFGAINIIKKD